MQGTPTGLRGHGLTEIEESTTPAGVRLLGAVVPEQKQDQVGVVDSLIFWWDRRKPWK